MKSLIRPASVNEDVIRAYIARNREWLDDIERELANAATKPNRVIYVFINRAALIGDLAKTNTRAWALEWVRNGASMSQAAKAARLSHTGLGYWKEKQDDDEPLPSNEPQADTQYRPDDIVE